MTRTKHYVDVTLRVVVECDEGVDPADLMSVSNYELAYEGEDGEILETEMTSAEHVGVCDENGVLVPLARNVSDIPFETITPLGQTPDEYDVDTDYNGDLEDK